MSKLHSFIVKSCGVVVVVVVGGGLLDYTVSYLGKPRSLTINNSTTGELNITNSWDAQPLTSQYCSLHIVLMMICLSDI